MSKREARIVNENVKPERAIVKEIEKDLTDLGAKMLAPMAEATGLKPDEPEKTITIVCTKGIWSSKLETLNDKVYITKPDLTRILRSLKYGHKLYVRELNLRLRKEKRLVEESKQDKAKSLEPQGV